MTDTIDQVSLSVVRQQRATAAIAAGFRDLFLFVCVVIAALPIAWLILRRLDRVPVENTSLALPEKS